MSYWDTSTLVKLYVKEADSTTFENYFLGQPDAPSTSEITLYEAHATFRRKEMHGLIPNGGAQSLYSQFVQDIAAAHFKLVSFNANVEPEYSRVLSACYARNPAIPMRTLDAIHLACAKLAGETEIVATDRTLRLGAKQLGFALFPS